ncbi:hypothetical protein FOL47_000146 [Perkinsus chesapeaki]|uniref:Uncharacterized protein n=1 Tax=Perkinsus chesapeaki TaxID=330153 RepID=A0A7J6MMD2_PERCH|nr:hypothetical protein FOL47_000146 [Perkinsus chesapeaki]
MILLLLLIKLGIHNTTGTNIPVTPDELPSGIYRSTGLCSLGHYGKVTMEVTTLEYGQGARLTPLDNFDLLGMSSAVPLYWMSNDKQDKTSSGGTAPPVALEAELILSYPLERINLCIMSGKTVLVVLADDFVKQLPHTLNIHLRHLADLTRQAKVPKKARLSPRQPPNSRVAVPPSHLVRALKANDMKLSTNKRPSTVSASELGAPSSKVGLASQAGPSTAGNGRRPSMGVQAGTYYGSSYGEILDSDVIITSPDGITKTCRISFTLKSGGGFALPVMDLLPSRKAQGCENLRLPSDANEMAQLVSALTLLKRAANAKGRVVKDSLNICNNDGMVLWFMSIYTGSSKDPSAQFQPIHLHPTSSVNQPSF